MKTLQEVPREVPFLHQMWVVQPEEETSIPGPGLYYWHNLMCYVSLKSRFRNHAWLWYLDGFTFPTLELLHFNVWFRDRYSRGLESSGLHYHSSSRLMPWLQRVEILIDQRSAFSATQEGPNSGGQFFPNSCFCSDPRPVTIFLRRCWRWTSNLPMITLMTGHESNPMC